MTLLHTNYGSGNIFTAGNTGGTVGPSGINDITNRINFGGFDFPQNNQVTTYITDSNRNIISGLVVGDNQSYAITGSYGVEAQPVEVIFSGTTLGSTITYKWTYQTGSYGAGATGSLISGTTVFT